MGTCEIVIRRVGGLEEGPAGHACNRAVIRRVGGLEEAHEEVTARDTVIRRVGGLEDRGRRSDAGI